LDFKPVKDFSGITERDSGDQLKSKNYVNPTSTEDKTLIETHVCYPFKCRMTFLLLLRKRNHKWVKLKS